MSKTIVTYIPSRTDFMRLLENNPGLIIIKLGASWCGPCKTIKPVVEAFFASSPDKVLCCDLDVDECTDMYAFLKSKKMVNGIPALLCYKQGNTTFIPDDSVTGSNPAGLNAFFTRCGTHLARLPPTSTSVVR